MKARTRSDGSGTFREPPATLRPLYEARRVRSVGAVQAAITALVAGGRRVTLAAAFRLGAGKTPHDYQVGVRIDAARRMPAREESPVHMAGPACGFPNASRCARVFRAAWGAARLPSERVLVSAARRVSSMCPTREPPTGKVPQTN